MEYASFMTASGKSIVFPLRRTAMFREVLEGLRAESGLLAERETPYERYIAKRLGTGPLSPAEYAITISRSTQKGLDRFDDSLFARLDAVILTLSNRPRPAGCKQLKWLRNDLWLIQPDHYPLVYAIDNKAKRLRVLTISYPAIRWMKAEGRRSRRSATGKPRVPAVPAVPKGRSEATPNNQHALTDLDWQNGYSGQTVEELLSFEKSGKKELLVRAFAQAIQEKAARRGRLSEVERVVLAVRKLDSTMVTDGIDNFFMYSPQLAATIVESLLRIGCRRVARIAQRALNALQLTTVSAKRITAEMARPDERREEELSKCNAAYWKAPGPARQLFAFIKANKNSVKF